MFISIGAFIIIPFLFLVHSSVSFLRSRVMSYSFIHPTNIHQISSTYQSLFKALRIQQCKNKAEQKNTPCPCVARSLRRSGMCCVAFLRLTCLCVFHAYVSYPFNVFIQCPCFNLTLLSVWYSINICWMYE